MDAQPCVPDSNRFSRALVFLTCVIMCVCKLIVGPESEMYTTSEMMSSSPLVLTTPTREPSLRQQAGVDPKPRSLRSIFNTLKPSRAAPQESLAPSPSDPFPFLSLPPEVRNKIYALVISNDNRLVNYVWWEGGRLRGDIRVHPQIAYLFHRDQANIDQRDKAYSAWVQSSSVAKKALLRVNRQVRAESLGFFWTNVFQAADITSFGRLLRAAGQYAPHFVRTVQIGRRVGPENVYNSLPSYQEMRTRERFLIGLWLLEESERPLEYLRLLCLGLCMRKRLERSDGTRSTAANAIWRLAILPDRRLWYKHERYHRAVEDMSFYYGLVMMAVGKAEGPNLLKHWENRPSRDEGCKCRVSSLTAEERERFYHVLSMVATKKGKEDSCWKRWGKQGKRILTRQSE